MKRRVLTVVLAALLAVLGAAAVLAYVRQANNRAAAGLKPESVLQATGPIQAGTSLGTAWSQHLLKITQIPTGSLSETPVRAVTAGNRKLVVTALVSQGEYLTQHMINTSAALVTSGGIIIQQGMEAVTIPLCLSMAVGGYVPVGSYVSVFNTYTLPSGANKNLQQTCDVSHQAPFVGGKTQLVGVNTRLVLTKAHVIAVGPASASQGTSSGIASTVSVGSGGNSNPVILVTLEVPQADAERLIQLAEVGLPYLALLPTGATGTYDPNTPLQLFRTH